jgi:hypothetical protein
MAISSTLDVSQLVASLDAAGADLASQLAGAVNTAARQSRTATVKHLAKSLHLRPREVQSNAATELRRASPSTLSARWTPSRGTLNVVHTGTVKWSRGSPLTFSTPSHGGEITRASRHGFLLNRKAFHRVASAAGKGRMFGLKPLKTISPNTLIGQEGDASRETWMKTAEQALPTAVERAVNRTFARLGFSIKS